MFIYSFIYFALKLGTLVLPCHSSWTCFQPGAGVGLGKVGLLWDALTSLQVSPLVKHGLLAALDILILKFHIEFQRQHDAEKCF